MSAYLELRRLVESHPDYDKSKLASLVVPCVAPPWMVIAVSRVRELLTDRSVPDELRCHSDHFDLGFTVQNGRVVAISKPWLSHYGLTVHHGEHCFVAEPERVTDEDVLDIHRVAVILGAKADVLDESYSFPGRHKRIVFSPGISYDTMWGAHAVNLIQEEIKLLERLVTSLHAKQSRFEASQKG